MFLIDPRIQEEVISITQEKSYQQRIKLLNNFDSKFLDEIRKPVIKYVGEKCFFCNNEITKEDTILPNVIYDSHKNHISHGNCLNYAKLHYNNIPISQMGGMIIRTKVMEHNRNVL